MLTVEMQKWLLDVTNGIGEFAIARFLCDHLHVIIKRCPSSTSGASSSIVADGVENSSWANYLLRNSSLLIVAFFVTCLLFLGDSIDPALHHCANSLAPTEGVCRIYQSFQIFTYSSLPMTTSTPHTSEYILALISATNAHVFFPCRMSQSPYRSNHCSDINHQTPCKDPKKII